MDQPGEGRTGICFALLLNSGTLMGHSLQCRLARFRAENVCAPSLPSLFPRSQPASSQHRTIAAASHSMNGISAFFLSLLHIAYSTQGYLSILQSKCYTLGPLGILVDAALAKCMRQPVIQYRCEQQMSAKTDNKTKRLSLSADCRVFLADAPHRSPHLRSTEFASII